MSKQAFVPKKRKPTLREYITKCFEAPASKIPIAARHPINFKNKSIINPATIQHSIKKLT